ncbi:hypothetical protein OnM2_030028 [Erysiphe neolycopersici]|uniref:Uncharacterized protein n=1 Tax=Erysiphe neolycopersici TaxID=212602 RepID=A0A420HZF2_9PEZI|nr:hypothetical protein OnM2_030028 [Erysiphe neolycopersici]
MTLPSAPSRESNHSRIPSLGQIHQSVEEEQEAQVNRLLQMIHNEQQHLWHLRNTRDQLSTHTTTDEVVTAPLHHVPLSPERSFQNVPRSIDARVSQYSIDNNERPNPQCQDSKSFRKTVSPGPAMMPESREDGESFAWCYRDDIAFYQAETQMMTRENQMLRRRIRELGLSPYPSCR